MNYRADIYDERGNATSSQYLNVHASGDRLRDMDTAGNLARGLLRPGQYADLYEHDGVGGASYVDTIHAQEVTR